MGAAPWSLWHTLNGDDPVLDGLLAAMLNRAWLRPMARPGWPYCISDALLALIAAASVLPDLPKRACGKFLRSQSIIRHFPGHACARCSIFAPVLEGLDDKFHGNIFIEHGRCSSLVMAQLVAFPFV